MPESRGMVGSAFVDACEDAISVENQVWMIQWTKSWASERTLACSEIIRSTCAVRLSGGQTA